MGFLSLDYPFFHFFCRFSFVLDFRAVLEQIFVSIEEISVLYYRDSDLTKVQTKIEAKNLDFLSLMGFLSLNCAFS